MNGAKLYFVIKSFFDATVHKILVEKHSYKDWKDYDEFRNIKPF
ncbi:MAG: hypothetical protein ACK521_04070 [bacterium]